MLSFLFNRESFFVRIVEGIAVFFSILYLSRIVSGQRFDGTVVLFIFSFGSYLFLRLCHGIRWYPNPSCTEKAGIALHFMKVLVPAAYLLSLLSGFSFFSNTSNPGLFFSIFVALALGSMAAINGILIYLHQKDTEPLPPNYFSHNHYEKEKNSPSPSPHS